MSRVLGQKKNATGQKKRKRDKISNLLSGQNKKLHPGQKKHKRDKKIGKPDKKNISPNLEWWDPEGWGTEGWGSEGAPKGGAQNFALFFSLPRHNFLSSHSWGSFRGILVGFFGVLGLSCASPGGPVWWGRRGFTRQPESPNAFFVRILSFVLSRVFVFFVPFVLFYFVPNVCFFCPVCVFFVPTTCCSFCPVFFFCPVAFFLSRCRTCLP